MHISSTKVLALMADQPESLILFELGAPYRDDLKGLCVTVKFPDGRELPIPSVMLDDLIMMSLLSSTSRRASLKVPTSTRIRRTGSKRRFQGVRVQRRPPRTNKKAPILSRAARQMSGSEIIMSLHKFTPVP